MAAAGQIRFALNHMAAPQLGLPEFFALARRLGIADVEIRNDIAGRPILDGTPAATVRAMAAGAGVEIATINALQRFNDWSDARAAEARALADYARACGARALILVPTNDGTGGEAGLRRHTLREALAGLAPILDDMGVTGLVEPLGFTTCSLRSKAEAAAAIAELGREQTFQITHDTFHHALAAGADWSLDPIESSVARVGLVHISGVVDQRTPVDDLRDAHRVLVRAGDRIGNLDQIRALRAAGYDGLFSFEPFADELRTLTDPYGALRASMDFIEAELAAVTA